MKVTDEITIQDGEIVWRFYAPDAAMLAKACSIAAQNVSEPGNDKDMVAFRAFAAMFKAITVAAVSQTDMLAPNLERTNGYVLNLLSMTEGKHGGV